MPKNQNYLKAADNNIDEVVVFYTFDTKGGQPKLMTEVRIDGIKMAMEIESGAAISHITRKIYLDKFFKCVLKLSKLVATRHNGTRSRPLGYFMVWVVY